MDRSDKGLRNLLDASYREYLKTQKSKTELAEYYQIHQERFYQLLKKINQILVEKPGAKVLDVGIYPPFLAIALKHLGAQVEGISSPLEDSDYPGINTKQLNVEIEKLPYRSASFDIVIFTEILEHLYRSPRLVIPEIYRVLKPGGEVLLTTPNLTRLFNRLKIFFGRSVNQDIDYYLRHFDLNELYFRHNREYTLDEVIRLLRGFGFKIEEANCFNSYTPNRKREGRVVEKSAKIAYFWLTQLKDSWKDTLYTRGQKPY